MSRIERWTRNLLENEARKRGIRDAEARSGTELFWAIAKHDYGARQSLRTARKLVGSIVDGLPLLSSRHSAEQQPSLPVSTLAEEPQPLAAGASPVVPSSLQLRREAGQLELSWQVNARDKQLAQRLLGGPGELSLRIVCVQADATQVVRSSVTEHGPLDPNGVWSWTLPGPDTHCVGAVGVRQGDRFISIAHQSSRAVLNVG
ncbi:MAG TPA: hypothetical protein VFN67_39180 [Polyangiales bacterium]|nr:hypothetical protein [Polyangiales bacterium]